jgi:PelA/Pel-15E family pectate lyase
VVPDEPGKQVHIILEVTDDGDPPLKGYQRIIFNITDANANPTPEPTTEPTPDENDTDENDTDENDTDDNDTDDNDTDENDTDVNTTRLPQDGNPVHARFELYKDYIDKADNVLSYQLDCGGWPKNTSYDSPGSGGDGNGTFDNGATTMELTLMAAAYNSTGETKYLESARKAMDYIFEAQYPEGGWPQFYPLKGGYADHVTFNDDAMSRTMTLLQKAVDKTPPFHTDVLTDEQRSKLQGAIDRGIDYILKAQYVQNGKKTVWCAQHGKSDYEPKQGRSYEWPSLSGSESVEIIGLLMFVPQTPEIKEAAINAVNWFNSPDTYLQDYAYVDDEFIPQTGSRVWARFHDLETNLPVFSTYNAPMYVGLEYQDKKKPGYRWGGTWGETIISYAKNVGYID